MPEATLRRLRHAVGNCARRLSSPWRERTLSPDHATTIFGCGFGDLGWHHLRRTLAEHDADPAIGALDTTLARFLKEFTPASISTLAGVVDETPLPLFVYPWGTFNDGAATTDKDAAHSRFCGPSTDAFIEAEFRRTIALHEAMHAGGYRPYAYPHSFISGTWLVARNGERRFVVMQGNHRMASLAHLGVRAVRVRTSRLALAEVREQELPAWPLVAARRCSQRHAKQVFDFFFRESGWHVARLLGVQGATARAAAPVGA